MAKRKKYTPLQKAGVIRFINAFNAKNGRGGSAAAVKKYGITFLTLKRWLDKSEAKAAPKATKKVLKKAAKRVAKKAKKKVVKKERRHRRAALSLSKRRKSGTKILKGSFRQKLAISMNMIEKLENEIVAKQNQIMAEKKALLKLLS